jgi:hypothetical protein
MVNTKWQTIQYSDTNMSGFRMFLDIWRLVIRCLIFRLWNGHQFRSTQVLMTQKRDLSGIWTPTEACNSILDSWLAEIQLEFYQMKLGLKCQRFK